MIITTERQKPYSKYKEQYNELREMYTLAGTVCARFNLSDAPLAKKSRELILATSQLLDMIEIELENLSTEPLGIIGQEPQKISTEKLEQFFAALPSPSVLIEYIECEIEYYDKNFKETSSKNALQELEGYLDKLPKKLDLALIKAQIEQIKQKMAAHETAEVLTDKCTGKEQIDLNAIRTLRQKWETQRMHNEQLDIGSCLKTFNSDITKMSPKTQEVALTLAKEFGIYADTYCKSKRTYKDKKDFMQSCRNAVDQKKPILDDVGFWRKVQNILTALWNAITPNSLNTNFFKTELANKTVATLDNLEKITRLK